MPALDDNSLVERLTGAALTDPDLLPTVGPSRQEELRQKLRKKQDKSREEEQAEQSEEEESAPNEWDAERGLHNAAMLIRKVGCTL